MDSLATFAVATITILNPLGNTPIFMSVTAQLPAKQKTQVALQTTLAVLVIMLLAIWLGEHVLDFFGISIAAFKLAGSLLVAKIGLQLISSDATKGTPHAFHTASSISVVPLALPVTAGPGTISTLIAHMDSFHSVQDYLYASGVAVLAAIIVWICYFYSNLINKLLGATGIIIMSKIMGLILLSIAFSMGISGASISFPNLIGVSGQ